jgi:hypothetical protein
MASITTKQAQLPSACSVPIYRAKPKKRIALDNAKDHANNDAPNGPLQLLSQIYFS